jgi:ribonuclease HI
VANRDLWEPLIAIALAPEVPVTFRWVKGHSGDHWNDRVDELATLAADTGTGSSGSSS